MSTEKINIPSCSTTEQTPLNIHKESTPELKPPCETKCEEKKDLNQSSSCCEEKKCENNNLLPFLTFLSSVGVSLSDNIDRSPKNLSSNEDCSENIRKLQMEFMRSLQNSWQETQNLNDEDDLPPLVDNDKEEEEEDEDNEDDEEEDNEEDEDDEEEDNEEDEDDEEEEDEDDEDEDNEETSSVVDEIINRMGVMNKVREYTHTMNVNGLLHLNDQVRNEILNEIKTLEEEEKDNTENNNTEDNNNTVNRNRLSKGLCEIDNIRKELLAAKKYQSEARWRKVYMIIIWLFCGMMSFFSDPYVKTALVGTYFMILFRSLFGNE